ncbi:MAG TPA: ATP-dependent DNA ligase [Terriglobales bacterium]|nr:ATP-dependent DNA ligase [Terriglobales bacterium]
MQSLATAAEALASTAKKTQKLEILADYLKSRSVEEAAASAIFFSGHVFPVSSEMTLQIGGAMLWGVLQELTGKSEGEMSAAYRRSGDAGAAAEELLAGAAPAESTLNVMDTAEVFLAAARASGKAAKTKLIHELLRRATAVEAKYIVKIITGDLRIGLKESLVEEAIAKAYDAPLEDVRRANMMLGDVGETLRLAAGSRLGSAAMRLFHPLGFMLASPVASAEEAFEYIAAAVVEDKYDGIRAQAHAGGLPRRARLFSRTRDDVTASFPELEEPLAEFPGEVVLDGEIVAWDATAQRALPFAELQKRLGRKKVGDELMRSIPVAYVAFDVLYAGDELLLDRPLRERALLLDGLFARRQTAPAPRVREGQGKLDFAAEGEPMGGLLRAPQWKAETPPQLNELFEQALARGNEGLMIKDPESPYKPGSRGRWWLKLKRELATLDVVVTAAEYGHGKRAGVLSDVTFAVRDGERLLNVGKAYSGLTDGEIAELTQWFVEHTLTDEGRRRQVEPKMVLEVAFNAVMRSDRHESGYALRFPRILRIRNDKSAGEIDTLERVREIFEKQRRP